MSADRPPVLASQLLAEQATHSFLLTYQYFALTGRRLKIGPSLGDGVYAYDLLGEPIPPDLCEKLTAGILQLLSGSVPLELVPLRRDVLLQHFTRGGYSDKVGVLKSWQKEEIPCLRVGDYIDFTIEPVSTDLNRLKLFEVRPYRAGIVQRYPRGLDPWAIGTWHDPQVLHDMFAEYAAWVKLLNCSTVAELNDIIYRRKIDELKWVAEGLHDQKFVELAEYLAARVAAKRIVTIAGPSSSNKTTFAKRLAIGLRVHGFDSLVIEMDDYFQDADAIPFGPDGIQDFEHISAMNTEVLGDRVRRLLAGETIPSRRFNFPKGKGEDNPKKPLTLPAQGFLIIEGIHGMNPLMLEAIGGKDKVCPIYVSALTPVSIDSNHRFPTTSLRLIRRMVRDYHFRGQSPRMTLQRWNSVRRGEEMNIFPYQANAELFFNSALVYELPVLATFAKGLLAEASFPAEDENPESVQAQEVSREALRLQGLLSFFYPIAVEVVPHISALREFIGGSDLEY
jgi:uridine kinase